MKVCADGYSFTDEFSAEIPRIFSDVGVATIQAQSDEWITLQLQLNHPVTYLENDFNRFFLVFVKEDYIRVWGTPKIHIAELPEEGQEIITLSIKTVFFSQYALEGLISQLEAFATHLYDGDRWKVILDKVKWQTANS